MFQEEGIISSLMTRQLVKKQRNRIIFFCQLVKKQIEKQNQFFFCLFLSLFFVFVFVFLEQGSIEGVLDLSLCFGCSVTEQRQRLVPLNLQGEFW